MIPRKLHFFIIDDDEKGIELYKAVLVKAGHQVSSTSISTKALDQIISLQPDCVLSDLVMPDMDGLELFQAIRNNKTIKQPTFILITGKVFESDRKRAFEMGIDGYLMKPFDPETFVTEILEIMEHRIVIQFWGVRGTLPVPGKKTNRYGGNTNCVTLNYANKQLFIFDAGSGMKELSNHMLEKKQFPISAKIFITHPHYDHIHGIPFFVPLYMKGNKFEVLGCPQYDRGIEKLISDQMDSIYFPITISEFAANLTFHDLKEESFKIEALEVKTILLNHPGKCLGYRIQYKEKSFCYITDNELYLEDSPNYNQFEVDRLVNFIQGTDVLVMDSTYTDKEYLSKVGWGHSCISRVVDVADRAKVKLLCLFHHDPDQVDEDIDAKLAFATSLLEARQSTTKCIAPHEGDKIEI